MTLPAVRQYQQAGLVVYGDDDNYLKLVVQGRTADPGQGRQRHPVRQGGRRHGDRDQHQRPRRGVPRHGLAADDQPRRARRHRLLQRGRRRPSPTCPAARTSARSTSPGWACWPSPTTRRRANITAQFDHFKITPDDTAVPCGGGGSAAWSRSTAPRWATTWEVVRPTGNLTVAGGDAHHPDGRHGPLPDHQHRR